MLHQPRRKSALVIAALLLSCTPLALCDTIYHADFENKQMPGWCIPKGREDRTRLELSDREAKAPTYKNSAFSLRLVGTGIWNIAELQLEKPVPLDGPVYLVCAWRSEGPAGQVGVGLLVEGRTEPVISETGRIGRNALGRWERIVARLDRLELDLKGAKLQAVRFAQRCAVGTALPDGRGPEHELLIDDVSILTPPDSKQAEAIAHEEAAPREYQGPLCFAISRSQDLVVWHSPSLAPVMKKSPVPKTADDAVRLTAARREAESFQLVATLAKPTEAVLILEPSVLVGPRKARIPDGNGMPPCEGRRS